MLKTKQVIRSLYAEMEEKGPFLEVQFTSTEMTFFEEDVPHEGGRGVIGPHTAELNYYAHHDTLARVHDLHGG
jgi:hypothetical protein